MPRTDAAASLTAVCAASSQLFGDSARTSITLIRAIIVPPESVWAAYPISSTAYEEDRCAVIGYGRVIYPAAWRAAQFSRTSTRFCTHRPNSETRPTHRGTAFQRHSGTAAPPPAWSCGVTIRCQFYSEATGAALVTSS